MPHFVVECSDGILKSKPPAEVIEAVYETAAATGLFAASGVGGIKVRINAYEHFTTVNSQDDFIHVFANIMEGRTQAQKQALSRAIVAKLSLMFPKVNIISVNVQEFEKSTYCNRSMI